MNRERWCNKILSHLLCTMLAKPLVSIHSKPGGKLLRGLHWFVFVSTVTLALVRATVQAWKKQRKYYMLRDSTLKDIQNPEELRHSKNNSKCVQLFFGSSNLFSSTIHRWSRKAKEIAWKFKVPVFADNFGGISMRSCEKTMVYEEVGPFLGSLNVCEKGDVFCHLIFTKWGLQ